MMAPVQKQAPVLDYEEQVKLLTQDGGVGRKKVSILQLQRLFLLVRTSPRVCPRP